jgi:hypothetical protein
MCVGSKANLSGKAGERSVKVALAKHLQIAQTQGPKAGFNAYVETLERSGLDTAQASLNEIRGKGNKKAQFEFYCAKFGNKFGATPASVDEADDLAEQLRVLQARLTELQAQGIGVVATEDDTFVEDEDTSLDEVDDGWTQSDTDAENAIGRSLINRVLSPGRRTSRSTTSTTRTNRTTNGGNGVSDKENLWKPWSIARFGIQPVVGSTFTYKSKRANRNTVHQVTRVTPDGIYAKRIK